MSVVRFRVHLMITADGFERPESFRVDTYAAESWHAEQSAVEWLGKQPLTGARVLAVMSTEKIPRQP